MTRAERRRARRGMANCVICTKLRKLNDMGLCMACDPRRRRKDEQTDSREMIL